MRTVYIGWDPREDQAWQVARRSLLRHLRRPLSVHQLQLTNLQHSGLYRRPTHRNEAGRLIDELSIREDYDGSISTEHAIARFFLPHLQKEGWAIFVDGDVMFRGDISWVYENLDDSKAIYCVKHTHIPDHDRKMDGQIQTRYARKNWSSFMLFNCSHPSNRALTLDLLNSTPGRDLHAFCWLRDEEIGTLSRQYNYLVGYYTQGEVPGPVVVHFTEGLPDMPGYENCEFADEWRDYLEEHRTRVAAGSRR